MTMSCPSRVRRGAKTRAFQWTMAGTTRHGRIRPIFGHTNVVSHRTRADRSCTQRQLSIAPAGIVEEVAAWWATQRSSRPASTKADTQRPARHGIWCSSFLASLRVEVAARPHARVLAAASTMIPAGAIHSVTRRPFSLCVDYTGQTDAPFQLQVVDGIDQLVCPYVQRGQG